MGVSVAMMSLSLWVELLLEDERSFHERSIHNL